MDKNQELARLGLKQADYETSTIQDVAAAAKEFQRVLNSVPHLVQVEMSVTSQQGLGMPERKYYSFRITTVDPVYP